MKQSKLLSAALIFLITFLLSSCVVNEEPTCGNGYTKIYSLTDAQKQFIPYSDTDTLIFISDMQDTAMCVRLSSEIKYEIIESRSGVHPTCPSNYDNYEIKAYPWVDKRENIKLDVSLHYKLYTPKGVQTSAIRISFLDKLFYIDTYDINRASSSNYLANRIFFNDSIFKKVSLLLYVWDVPSDTIFYNTQYGVCGATINNKKWVLLHD